MLSAFRPLFTYFFVTLFLLDYCRDDQEGMSEAGIGIFPMCDCRDLPLVVNRARYLIVVRCSDVWPRVMQGQPQQQQQSRVAEWAEDSQLEMFSPSSGYLAECDVFHRPKACML